MAKALAKKGGTLAKGGAKPGKASAPKAKAEKAPNFKEGQSLEFLGYTNANDEPVYQPGDRIVFISTEKNSDNQFVLNTVKEADYEAYKADPEDEDVAGDQVFPAEVKKAEKLAVDPYAFQLVHVGKLDEILEQNDNDPLAAYTATREAAEESFFYMGGFIAELYKDRKFREYGDYEDETDGDKVKHGTGWAKFARDQLDMDARKAHASMQVYRRFSAIPGFDPATIGAGSGLGWVKLQLMANTVTADNVEELIERAKDTPVEEFREVIRTEYVADREAQGTARQSAPKVKRVAFNFKLFEDQGEGVKLVFDTAKKETGITDENQLLERIVMEWARDHLSEAAFGKARSAKKRKLRDLKKAGHDVDDLMKSDQELDLALSGEEEEETETAEA